MPLKFLALTAQAVAIPLVALLLWQLARVWRRPFLHHWAGGLAALAVALLGLRFSVSFPAGSGWAGAGLLVYCGGEVVCGFLVWAGCRAAATGRPLTGSDRWVLLPGLAVAAGLALGFRDINGAFPFHAALFAGYLLLAWHAAGRSRPAGRHPPVGRWVVRGSLLALAAVFAHYAPVVYWCQFVAGRELEYLILAPLVDAFLQTVLAFGMALTAAERLRDELEAAGDRLARAADTDGLTGLLNRRALDALPPPPAGAVAVLDLNDLKRLNDEYGHAAGDVALQAAADALRRCVRGSDPVFRTGGDEFVVVLPNGREADLTARLEGLGSALVGVSLPGLSAPTDLTLAWGVAGFRSPDELSAALRLADERMYARKRRQKADRLAAR